MSVSTVDNPIEGPGPPDPPPPASEHGWVWQVSALSIALGILLALAIRTTAHIRSLGLPSNRFGVPAATLSRYKEQNEKLGKEVRELRDQVDQFRLTGRDGSDASALLKKQLAEYQAVLGFAPVEGPGLTITLRNSPQSHLPGTDPSDYLANAEDVNGLVSELWAAGAEAIAISGAGAAPERFVVSTTVQPGGNGVAVNGRILSAPYRIQVIGNPKELSAAVRMPEGIIENRGLNVLRMIQIEETKDLVLPAYSRRSASANPPAAN